MTKKYHNYRSGTPQCAKCRTKKIFWKLIITEDKHRPVKMYACGHCVENLENTILNKRPIAHISRTLLDLVDFAEDAEGRKNAKELPKVVKHKI